MQPLKTNINEVPMITERGGTIQILISPRTVNTSHFILGVSRLAVNEKVKKHAHDFSEEAFFVLRGRGIISFDAHKEIIFGPGDAVHVPKGVAHQIENIGDEEMEVIFTASPLAPNPMLGHREIN